MPTAFLDEVPVEVTPSRADRLALRLLQAGAIAVVLLSVTYRSFDLDRFFVPKELVLHLTASAASLLALGALRRMRLTRVDLLLLAFLGASGLSALLSVNGWAAWRALAITASGLLVFWTSRALREVGLGRPLVVGMALAAALAAATALLQAYGVNTALFTENRAPGGTLGNRNFVAHLSAAMLPVMLFAGLRAWRPLGFLIAASGSALCLAALVLTRSRAAWLGLLVVGVVLVAGLIACGPVRRSRRYRARLLVLAVCAGAAVAAAVLLPNALRWRSESPYLETARGVVNYREGSGRGRLLQYRNSMGLLAESPLLGVGPGNWQARYAAHAGSGDPSLDRSQPGITANPWPSSDWIALLTERGLLGGGLGLLAGAGILLVSLRRIRGARDEEEGLAAITCVATIAGVATVGAFDAVLLLAWPTLLTAASVGALWPAEAARPALAAPPLRVATVGMLAAGAALSAARGGGQLAAMAIYDGEPGRAGLERAATLDPGNFRVRMAAARDHGAGSPGRCDHARAARELFPHSTAAQRLTRGCD